MVGGNLAGDTRVMTTAIVEFTRKGQYGPALGAGARAHGDRRVRQRHAGGHADVGRPLRGGRPMSAALSLSSHGRAQGLHAWRIRARSRQPRGAGRHHAWRCSGRAGRARRRFCTSSACSRSLMPGASCSATVRCRWATARRGFRWRPCSSDRTCSRALLAPTSPTGLRCAAFPKPIEAPASHRRWSASALRATSHEARTSFPAARRSGSRWPVRS